MLKYNKWIDDISRSSLIRKNTDDYYRLDMSERIFSFPNEIFDNFLKNINQKDISVYPSSQEQKLLCNRIAEINNVSNNQVLITAGSDIALRMIFEATCCFGKNVITTDPFFPMYEVYAKIAGAKLIKVQYDDKCNLKFNLTKILNYITNDTRLVVLSNPISPVGDYKTNDELRYFCKILSKKGIIFVIDEAYYEYSPGSAITLLKEFDNIVITRTLSKAYGLAGLRAGYIITSEYIRNILDKLRFTFPITTLTINFIKIIFDNIKVVDDYIKDTIETRNNLALLLDKAGYNTVNTDANWLHINSLDDNKKLQILFDKYNICTRFGNSLPFDDRKNWLRLTIGPNLINKQFINDMINLKI